MKEEIKINSNLNSEEDNTTYSFEKVLNLAFWAKVISNALFVIGIITFIIAIYYMFSNFDIQRIEFFDFFEYLLFFAFGLFWVFLGLILELFIQVSFTLVDIEQNTRNKS